MERNIAQLSELHTSNEKQAVAEAIRVSFDAIRATRKTQP
jgi:hypothetical protein